MTSCLPSSTWTMRACAYDRIILASCSKVKSSRTQHRYLCIALHTDMKLCQGSIGSRFDPRKLHTSTFVNLVMTRAIQDQFGSLHVKIILSRRLRPRSGILRCWYQEGSTRYSHDKLRYLDSSTQCEQTIIATHGGCNYLLSTLASARHQKS